MCACMFQALQSVRLWYWRICGIEECFLSGSDLLS